MTRSEKAEHLMMQEEFSCSQAVLEVFCDDFGADLVTARKVAALFGGGMKHGGMCGVVTGALMVLGLKYGQVEPMDVATKKASAPIAREFIKRFEEKGHALGCEALLGVNTSTPEGAAYASEHKLHRKICVGLIEETVEILEDMLGL